MGSIQFLSAFECGFVLVVLIPTPMLLFHLCTVVHVVLMCAPSGQPVLVMPGGVCNTFTLETLWFLPTVLFPGLKGLVVTDFFVPLFGTLFDPRLVSLIVVLGVQLVKHRLDSLGFPGLTRFVSGHRPPGHVVVVILDRDFSTRSAYGARLDVAIHVRSIVGWLPYLTGRRASTLGRGIRCGCSWGQNNLLLPIRVVGEILFGLVCDKCCHTRFYVGSVLTTSGKVHSHPLLGEVGFSPPSNRLL